MRLVSLKNVLRIFLDWYSTQHSCFYLDWMYDCVRLCVTTGKIVSLRSDARPLLVTASMIVLVLCTGYAY
jgi:hypothetical protein